MKSTRLLLAIALTGITAQACMTTTRSSATWSAEPQPGWARRGHVEWVRENVQRQDGNPAAGAAAGAVIGALIGGRGPAMIAGAVGGAALGAAASQGHAERRWYEVMVRFDDGYAQAFTYADYSPFRPGEPVFLTDQGLMRG